MRKHRGKAMSKFKVGVTLMVLGVASAHAHTGKHEAKAHRINYTKAEETPFGKAADPRKAGSVVVHMSDTMRFSPSEIVVNKGDIVRFEVKNDGKVLHEMVLGTKKELKEHAVLMKKFPDMEHDEPHMLHVPPGKSGEMGWQFTRAGEFYFACLIPGHYEAGMVGKVIVKDVEEYRMARPGTAGQAVLGKRPQ
jgi:uncharacterized cupredoxin-like copper-binding protein